MNSASFSLVNKVSSLALFPYLAIVIFTIPYFIHQKIFILRQIRNIPPSTVLAINLRMMKKNLQIKSMIHNWIIIISSFEAIVCLLNTINYTINAFGSSHSNNYVAFVVFTYSNNGSCTLHGNTTLAMFSDISEYLVILLPIPLNLSLIVIRRVYLNAPYKSWVIGYSVYFLFRLVYLVLSAYCLITSYTENILELPFLLFDTYVYVNASKKLYLLLKGMSEEAKWHSTQREYRNRRRTTQTFAITRAAIFLTFILCVLILTLNSMSEVYALIQDSDCLLQYAFPNTPLHFSLPSSSTHILSRMVRYIEMIRMVCNVMVGGIAFLSNLAILTWIIAKLIVRRKVYIHVNDWITRPLMERYRADVERNYYRRPPFIQAFRSQLIY